MQVHARFYLIEDGRTKFYTGEDAIRVKFAAVKGEPFGPATPQGTIDMLIVNPEAIAVFRDAPINQQFDVVFSSVEQAPE